MNYPKLIFGLGDNVAENLHRCHQVFALGKRINAHSKVGEVFKDFRNRFNRLMSGRFYACLRFRICIPDHFAKVDDPVGKGMQPHAKELAVLMSKDAHLQEAPYSLAPRSYSVLEHPVIERFQLFLRHHNRNALVFECVGGFLRSRHASELYTCDYVAQENV